MSPKQFNLPAGVGDLDTGRRASPQLYNYSILTNENAIEALTPQITGLLNQTGQVDVRLEPGYFLVHNVERSAPAVVLIGQNNQVAAVLYGRHRRLLGIKTGVVECGDYYGDCAIIAQPDFKPAAAALGALKLLELPGIHTVRVSLKIGERNEIATIESIVRRARVRSRILSQPVQHSLVLENTFEGFLNKLGSHTRRNLRVYRRRVEQQGWRFHPRLGPAEVEAGVRTLERQQGKYGGSAHYLDCCCATLKKVPGSFYAGVCTGTGEWVSLAGGWLRNDRYFMLIQLNDARHWHDSVSTVMRSYLIEHLIGSGVKIMIFIDGLSELLGRFCISQGCAHYLFEKGGVLSAARGFVGARFFRNSLLTRIPSEGKAPSEIAAAIDSTTAASS